MVTVVLAGCTGSVGPGSGEPLETPADVTRDPTLPALPPAAGCGQVDVGFGRLKRLTRAEYDAAVRTVLGDTSSPASGFVTDERGGAFFVNDDAEITEAVYRHYVEAAERVADNAVKRIDQIFPCSDSEATCARRFVTDLGRRLYRRPVASAEVDRLLAAYTRGRDGADHKAGLRLALSTMLQSPHFLYHFESGAAGAKGDVVPLAPHELAARLSWFLWRAPPDVRLLDAAEQGRLAKPEQIAAEAKRLLDDPRAAGTIRAFYEQWLRLDRLDTAITDAAMRESVRAETLTFVERLHARPQATVQDLFVGREAVLDDRSRTIYGVAASGPATLDGAQRAGLLTRAAFLASNKNVPARGKFVLNELFCHHLEVPPDVDTTLPPKAASENPRQHIERHKENPACNGCHTLLDPIGHAFWHYDDYGKYRTTLDGWKVDASGGLSGTEKTNGPFYGAVELSQRLGAAPEVPRCLARQWFRFALGREPDEARDRCTFQSLDQALDAGRLDLKGLLLAMTQTPAFTMVRLRQEVKP